jgi:5-hydroxyisourate hydrolase-like protein (transthyretin family)
MNNVQENHLKMQLTTAAYCDNTSCSLSTLPAYTTNLTKLFELNTEIKTISELQKTGLSGITNNKNQIRKNLITLGADTARKVNSYAKLNGNLTLAGEVNFTETDLKRCTDLQLRDYQQIIYNKAQEILPLVADYGITEDTQAALLLNINAFNSVLSAPRLGITTKSQATKQLVELFKLSNEALEKLDLAVEIIRLSDVVFYNGYHTARKIIAKGNTKLAVRGTVIEEQNGEPIRGVAVSFVLDGQENGIAKATDNGAQVVKKTAAKGGFTIKSLASGIYKVSFKKSGYVEQVVTANVNDGELTVINIALAKNEG